jgi:SAM-dependent methyltransferase
VIAYSLPRAAGTGGSVVVSRCQVCDAADLESLLFLGFLPPVNTMRPLGERPHEQPSYPAEWLRCRRCQLVQIGLIVDPQILFPPEYPYTSGTTRILRENFAELYKECGDRLSLGREDLVVDIGSNDGTLLSNFQNRHRVLGIEPTQAGQLARERGIATLTSFFGPAAAETVLREHGPARLVTATNVFAHVENVHEVVENVLKLLTPDGVFVTESHYLLALVETLQYDTIYHEHLRYYSLHSLQYLLALHGLEIFHAKRIPTHGGSIRVYAARKGVRPKQKGVEELLQREVEAGLLAGRLQQFKSEVVLSKLRLHRLLLGIKEKGERIYGIGAPSRASTLLNYVGATDGVIDCVLEVKGSHKIGKYMPGTLIPVVEESRLFQEQPEYALLLSWHIAEELAPKLKEKGFKGRYLVPLPEPRVLD